MNCTRLLLNLFSNSMTAESMSKILGINFKDTYMINFEKDDLKL